MWPLCKCKSRPPPHLLLQAGFLFHSWSFNVLFAGILTACGCWVQDHGELRHHLVWLSNRPAAGCWPALLYPARYSSTTHVNGDQFPVEQRTVVCGGGDSDLSTETVFTDVKVIAIYNPEYQHRRHFLHHLNEADMSHVTNMDKSNKCCTVYLLTVHKSWSCPILSWIRKVSTKKSWITWSRTFDRN
jgi:hypothetical protein